mgnify:CR=1 FL=1
MTVAYLGGSKLTTKEKILLAIYREYRQGISDMRHSVRHDGLQVDSGLFNREIQALQTDGLIRGAVLVRGCRDSLWTSLSEKPGAG